jgi:ribosomal protein S18 acetylase RimI-like enzyme
MPPPFPKAASPPPLSENLRRRGVALRGAAPTDLPFLRDLYADIRAGELALAPWSAEQKRAFTDDQFRLQHIHFTRYHARADFWIVEQGLTPALPRPIGRLYLDRSVEPWCIVEIGFLAEARGQGHGSAMIAWLQEEAMKARAPGIVLSVAAGNPRAEALYRRLGFIAEGESGPTHQTMRWSPEAEGRPLS